MTTVSEQHPAREPDDYGPGVRAALAEHILDPAEMLGERVTVEHVGLPSPDAHAAAAVDPDLETRVRSTIYLVEQSTIGRRFAARQIINTVREHDADGPRWTPALTISAAEVENLLTTHDGLRMQALDTGDETTWHDLSTVVECEDAHLLPADEGDEPDADPDYDACVVLVSAAFPRGVMHTPPAEGVTVRIEVAR